MDSETLERTKMAKKKRLPTAEPTEDTEDTQEIDPQKPILKVFVDIGGKKPTRSYEQDAGIDLYMPRDIYIEKFDTTTISMCVRIELPVGHCGVLFTRSSVSRDKHLIIIGDLIDEGYRGPIHLTLVNPNNFGVYVRKGERVSQLAVIPVIVPQIVEVEDPEEFSDAQRGEKGLGSTGT